MIRFGNGDVFKQEAKDVEKKREEKRRKGKKRRGTNTKKGTERKEGGKEREDSFAVGVVADARSAQVGQRVLLVSCVHARGPVLLGLRRRRQCKADRPTDKQTN